MPRNDQVTRQWYLLRKLESSRGAALQELVSSLPDDFPKNSRTIRRDLEALERAGFPLVTEHSDGQTRWKLMEGFRNIPALGFSPTELMSLIFSRNLLKPLAGTEIQSSLDSALNKAAAALPPQGHDYVRQMERIRFIAITDHPYQMPLGFNVEEYVQDVLMVMRGRPVEVELLFSKSAAAWARDKVWHQSQQTNLLKDGRMKMTIRAADTDELVGWILSFGSQVRVVRPDALRRKVKEEAGKIFRS